MKKFLIFIALIVAGYFAYDNFIKEKIPYSIKDSYNKQREGVNIENPSIQPADYGSYSGTIKNIGEKVLVDININYLIDAQPINVKINRLGVGEEKSFQTEKIRLRHIDPAHHLEKVTYIEEE